MRRLLLLLPLTGCFEYAAVDYTLDVKANRAALVYRDLRGDDNDFATLVKDLLPGDAFHSAFPKASVSREELVVNGETLEVQVDLQGSTPSDLGLQPWSPREPYRFCPPDNLVVTTSNATYRDADDCLVWKKGTRVLRVHAVPPTPLGGESLLGQYLDWVADGRPELGAAAEPAKQAP